MKHLQEDGVGFPEAEALDAQIRSRHQRGTLWRTLFQAATIVGVLALAALMINIINESFGLVAVQNEVEPESLVISVVESRILSAPSTVTSENDSELAEAIAADAGAIGFFGYAHYLSHQDGLKPVAVEGIAPSAETVSDGTYPLARPLYLYSTRESLQENPAALVLVNYYLSHAAEASALTGYFPAPDEEFAAAQRLWIEASQLDVEPGQWPAMSPSGVGGSLRIAGSSTLLPLSEAIVESMQSDGFAADVDLAGTGSTAGFAEFCSGGDVDIVTASRPIAPGEFEACRDSRLSPLEFRVASDALTIVTSRSNDFLTSVTREQLQSISTRALLWSDVDESWPNRPINRFFPGQDSGTLDVFAAYVFPFELEQLPKETLLGILQDHISVGLGRRLEREQRFLEDSLVFEDEALWQELCSGAEPHAGCSLPARSQRQVYALVQERVVVSEVVQTWPLSESLLGRGDIEAYATEVYPNAELQFRSWLTPSFIADPQSSIPELAGVRTALLGSLWVVAITMVFAFPVGVGAAIYLEEYAGANRLQRLIQTNINNLAGVPSIIYGMLGLAIFVRVMEPISSGAIFGVVDDSSTANGRTILSASLTLGLLILPLIIINAQEAIRAVPVSLRQAGYALGATKWQTIRHHVLPSALPGILTGTILAMSRALGETAPLVVVGASTFITVDPSSPFAKFTTLPIQIYQWTSRPQDEFRNIAAAAIIVLLILLLALNATAVVLRNRQAQRV